MKSIKFLMSSMLLVLCFTLPSCSKNDEVVQTSFIVGEWESGTESDSERSTVVFHQNGTFACKRVVNNEVVEEFSGTYVYNESTLTGTLTSNGKLLITMTYDNSEMSFVDDQGVLFVLRKREQQ